MFREMHHMGCNSRAMDLAEKMAERRRQSLAATSRPSLKARMARMLSALTVVAECSPAEGRE